MYKFLDFLRSFNRGRKKIEISTLPLLIRQILSILKWVFLKAFLLYYVLLQSFFSYSFVATGSLMPTCNTNDIFLLSTASYNIRFMLLSLISPRLYHKLSFLKVSKPKLGDIVAFATPGSMGQVTYQKRIVGVGGQTVQFKNGILYIDGKECKLTFKGKHKYVENDREYWAYLYEEDLLGLKHDVIFLNQPGNKNALDNTEEIKIPEKKYFLVGDNRHNSDDCRNKSIPLIDENWIIGKALFILLSNSNMRTLNLKQWFNGLKLDRTGKWIK